MLFKSRLIFIELLAKLHICLSREGRNPGCVLPRLDPGVRGHGNFRNKARGVAILMVMVALALMMALVTELSSNEVIRYTLAINNRDALQAEALAQSGANFAELILTVQEPLQAYLINFAKMGIQLPEYVVWKLFPIDSNLLKGMTEGFVPDFAGLSGKTEKTETSKQEDQETKESGEKEKEKEAALFGPYETPENGYGGFRGVFSTEIVDEESKISIRRWPRLESFPQRKMIAEQIFRIVSKKEYEPLFDRGSSKYKTIRPSQLVGNIYDYISEEDRALDVSAPKESFGRDFLGDKRSEYFDSPGISPKRAPMDSIAELRLVPGVNDAIYDLLAKILTVYGESDRINVLSASDEVLGSAFYVCAKNKETSLFQRYGFETDLLADWNRKKAEGSLEISTEGVIKFLEESGIDVEKEACNKAIGTESKVFTVKSTATVGRVTKTVLLRLRSASGITTIYQFQYL